jgi:hypothetical protein
MLLSKARNHAHVRSNSIAQTWRETRTPSLLVLCAAIVAFIVLSVSPLRATASDPACSPNLIRWYGVFVRETPVAPMKGGHGYIDGSVAMFASGLGENGVYRQDVGLESASCRSYAAPATYDNFTAQNWDDTWSPWWSGRKIFDAPVRGDWISQYTSGWSALN